MKNIALLILICGLFSTSNFAQGNYISGINVGVNGSYYSSGIYNEHNYGSSDLYNHGYTSAFSGGMNLSLSVNEIHEFQLEAVYSFQGQNWNDEHGSTSLEKKVRLQYFKLPFVYKYKMPFDAYNPYSPMHYFLAGMFMGTVQNASIKYYEDGAERSFEDAVASGNSFDVSFPTNAEDLFIPIDFGSIIGWGIEYPLVGNLTFSAETRLEVSVIDQNGLNYRYPSSTKGYRPSFNVLLGLKLGMVYSFYL